MSKPKPHQTIIILPDGETWSRIDGCTIVSVSHEQYALLAHGMIGVNNVDAITSIDLTEGFA